MPEESRNKKLLREINEEIDREKRIVAGMSKDERQVLAIVVMVIAVIAIVATLAYASIAHAAPVRITTQCLKGVCLIEADLYKALIESHNDNATRPQLKCKPDGDA